MEEKNNELKKNAVDEDISSITAQLHRLPRTAIQLRRAFGKSLWDAGIPSKVAYYEATGTCQSRKFSKLTYLNFFTVTLIASQIDSDGVPKVNMEDYLHKVYMDSSTSESQKKRITKMLSLQYEPDGYLIDMIKKFAKQARNAGIVINEFKLYRDIRYWNEDYNRIPERWAQKILKEVEL